MQLFKKKAYTLYYEDECPTCIEHDVTIGTQTWTGCNLNVTTYRNGDTIPQVTDQTDWTNLTTGAWCHINNDPANDAIYGKLYNWYAVNDPRGLAPLGWHVASYAEWDTLINSLGGDTVAGGKLKEVGLCHWLAPNTDATDQVLFTALPGGFRGGNGSFGSVGAIGQWWTSTEFDTTKAWMKYLLYNDGGVGYGQPIKNGGMSVRLIQDVVAPTPIDFYLDKVCIGSSLTQIVLDDISGGVQPYYPATDTFTSEALALANTSWSSTPNPGPVDVNYPETVAGTYWVAVKDSVGTVVTKSINANCPPEPQELDFTLSQTCDGEDITLTADNITGGTGPYVFSTTVFTNSTDALDNILWTTALPSNDYPVGNVPGEYWVSIKDSLGVINASGVQADCTSPTQDCSTYSVAPGVGTLEVEGYIGYNIVDYLDCAGDPQTISVSAYQSTQEICASAITGGNSFAGAVLVSEGTCIEPVFFDITQTCNGLDVYITVENVRGGAGGYQVSTSTFATQALALANTSWEPVSTATYTVTESPTEYWISVKDVNGNIGTNFIFAVDCVTPALCTCYTITNIGYPDLPGEEPALVGTNFSYIDCDGIPSLGVLYIVGNSVDICARIDTITIIGDPADIVVNSVADCCTTTPPDFGFTLSQTCSGSDITLVADNVTGGTGPYVFSTVAFTDPTDAIDNLVWTTPRTFKNYYIGNVPGTYWVSIKDSLGLIILQEIDADCWDSVNATRTSADLSANSYFSSAGACGSSSTQNIYIAYRNPGILSNGDRVFTTASGNTPFNGMIVSELDNWWKFNDPGTYSACVLGTAVRIDNAGYITNVSCC